MKRLIVTLALAALLSAASSSIAGDLVTPPAFVGKSTQVSCKLTNITSATIPAQSQLIQSGGTVLQDSGPTTVAAGDVLEIVHIGPGSPVYCRFLKASKSKVRADMTAFNDATDQTDQIIAVAQ